MKRFGVCLAVAECRNDLQEGWLSQSVGMISQEGLIAFRKAGVVSAGPDQRVCALQKLG